MINTAEMLSVLVSIKQCIQNIYAWYIRYIAAFATLHGNVYIAHCKWHTITYKFTNNKQWEISTRLSLNVYLVRSVTSDIMSKILQHCHHWHRCHHWHQTLLQYYEYSVKHITLHVPLLVVKFNEHFKIHITCYMSC